jgi:hypothetical protein
MENFAAARAKEIIMQDRSSGLMVTVAIAAASVSVAISMPVTKTSAQAPTASGAALKTPWGEPDLQGIWTDEFDTPLQRPAKYANQEYFTEAQRDELDKQRGALYGGDPRQERGSAVEGHVRSMCFAFQIANRPRRIAANIARLPELLGGGERQQG